MQYTRRGILGAGIGAGLGMLAGGSLSSRLAWGEDVKPSTAEVPVTCLTQGPKHHWFGYYDKLEFDPTNNIVLTNEVDFQHRSPEPKDSIKVGYVDLNQPGEFHELGSSKAWGWQQGCMLQWLPVEDQRRLILWNDRDDQHYFSRIYDFTTKEQRTINKPIYTVSPKGEWGLSLDFSRLQWLRPGYGYVGLPVTNADKNAPEDAGIWRVDLNSGEEKLIVSLAQLSAIPHLGKSLKDYPQWVNHLLVNPSGERFIFLHRWRELDPATGQPNMKKFFTRMFTADKDGKNLHLFETDNVVSHFIWRDYSHISAWLKPVGKSAGFYDYGDQSQEFLPLGPEIMKQDGHLTYLPGCNNEWIINDTYPNSITRNQQLYLYHVPTNRKFILGEFHSPPVYTGEWRCDLHCRSSRDGKKLVIDTPHGGTGRQIWLLDIDDLIKKQG